jgi:orotidine 5'-phosphate decarboxylase subfamily 2
METFFSFLEKRVDDCSSLLCIGLDPHVSLLPSPNAASALDFCLRIVKQTAPYAAAFKPNAAFFEFFGPAGWTALKQVIEAIDSESHRLGSMIPVILDAKRGDIASTAEAYAKSAFEQLGAHAITLNPYLGKDSIDPFLEFPEKGVFLLCKTSNPGAGDLQDLTVERGLWTDDSQSLSTVDRPRSVPLYIHVADPHPRCRTGPVVPVPRRWRSGRGPGNRAQSWLAERWQGHAHQCFALDCAGRESRPGRSRATR